MYITMNSDYALRAMMQLAQGENSTTVPIAQISRDADIPESFLRKIIPRLQRAGLIYTARGNQGGISLARPAASISILDIIIPIEENLGMHRCVFHHDGCDRKNYCVLHDVWEDLEIEVRQFLNARNLEQLVGRHQIKKRIQSA